MLKMTGFRFKMAFITVVALSFLALLWSILFIELWVTSDRLLMPSGPFHVGIADAVIDCPLATDIEGLPRNVQLAVRLWYPADPDVSGAAALYSDVRQPDVPTAPASGFMQSHGTRILRRLFGASRLALRRSIADAPLSAGARSYPVLLYHPGWGGRRTNNTVQAMELASHGFIVIGADDLLPTPSLDLSSEADAAKTLAWADRKVRSLADLMVALLDRLSRLDDTGELGRFAGRLDFQRIGMFGYSFGGAVAAEAALLDRRIRAVADLDGWLFGDVATTWIEQPFLIISDVIVGTVRPPEHLPYSERNKVTWDCVFTRQMRDGFTRSGGFLLEVSDAGHGNFNDAPLLWRWPKNTEAGRMAWFIFGRFWVTNGRAEGAAVEGRISVGGVVVRWRRSASPVQARWFRSGPRPSKVSQCGWLSPVINSRGLLPMRSTSWLRM